MAISKRLRYEILRRDNHACRYCGAAAPDVKLNVDHVIPQALGGSNAPTNLVTACAGCNAGKTSSMPAADTVADVGQDAFRQAAKLKDAARRKEVERLLGGRAPSTWNEDDYWRYAAEASWYHAWTIASDGDTPPMAMYDEFLDQRSVLESHGRSVEEIACAAVIAGANRTPLLSWGLSIPEARHAPISVEQYTRMESVHAAWSDAWLRLHGDTPDQELDAEFRGRLAIAARQRHSRDHLLQAARSAAYGRNAEVDYFAYHVACESADEKAGEV